MTGGSGVRVVACFDRVVQLLLPAAHVRVGRLHDQPGPGAELRIGSDIAIDHDHAGLRDMRVLDGRDAIVFGPDNGLPAGVGGVVNDVGGAGAARVDASLNVYVPELRERGVGHFLGQFAQPGRRGITLYPRAVHLVRHRLSSSWAHASRRGYTRAGTLASARGNAWTRGDAHPRQARFRGFYPESEKLLQSASRRLFMHP